ncbi:hypothetical protein KCU78_g22354, partial [Aureobasidium melanogenum]
MPLREKIKSLLHRHDDETTPPSSPNRQSRYEATSQGVSPQQGGRPSTSADQPSQASPARSRSKLRKSLDRKSAPAADDSIGRRSLDSKRKSLDQRQIDAGEAPSV